MPPLRALHAFEVFARLVVLSEAALPLPEPYFVCWGEGTMNNRVARDFLICLEYHNVGPVAQV